MRFTSHSILVCIVGAAAVACGKVAPLDIDGAVPPPGTDGPVSTIDASGPDAAPVACTPSTTVCDSRGHIVTCDATGKPSADVDCALGCMTGTTTCSQMEVSNGLTRYLSIAAKSNVDLVFPTGHSTIKASDGTVLINGAMQTVASEVVNGMRVFPVRSLNVVGQLAAIKNYSELDAPALVFVVAGDVTISSSIDLSADTDAPPPGSLKYEASMAAGCVGGDGGGDNLLASQKGGSGGGGGYHPGAVGGPSSAFPGGTAGKAPFSETLIPLRGGCTGGKAPAGGYIVAAGGGAIQIVSTTKIELNGIGSIDVGGGGGKATPWDSGMPGTGGGGGGAILLEAPTITLRGADVVLAAKGGGGGGTGVNVDGTARAIGQNGQLGEAPAQGGVDNASYLKGGNGGTALIAPTAGPGCGAATPCSTPTTHGAGGGGGAGQVRFNTRDGNVSIIDGAKVRAYATNGTITLQKP